MNDRSRRSQSGIKCRFASPTDLSVALDVICMDVVGKGGGTGAVGALKDGHGLRTI